MDGQEIVDFLLVASPRAGTTWLSTALAEHPQVWIPENKEVNFFNKPFLSHWEFKYDRGWNYYAGIFGGAPEKAVKGELTPTYYVDPQAVHRIKEHLPNVKILILLRNPAVVVHSTYLKSREYYPTAATLEEEIEKRPELLELGFFCKYLEPYYTAFGRENIYVGIYEEFFADLQESIASVYDFLGVDYDFQPSVLDQRVNVRRGVKRQWIIGLRHGIRKAVNTKYLLPLKRMLTKAVSIDLLDKLITEWNLEKTPLQPLQDGTRTWLMEMFEEDIRGLERLLQRDLGLWRTRQYPQ